MSMKRLALSALLALGLAACSACGAQQRPDGGRGLLPVGALAPDLTQPDHAGKSVHLRDAMPTLVYFYPRAGTPGCTKEACALRDAWDRYTQAGIRVVGVSNDSNERQQNFAKEHGLPFSLIADENHLWSEAFGVSTVMGMDKRRSFLLDAGGHIVMVYEDVDPGVHANQVLEDAARLGLVKPAE